MEVYAILKSKISILTIQEMNTKTENYICLIQIFISKRSNIFYNHVYKFTTKPKISS